MMKGFPALRTDLSVANCVLQKFWLKAHRSSLSVFVWFQEVKYVSSIWMTEHIHPEHVSPQSGNLRILTMENAGGRYFSLPDLHALNSPWFQTHYVQWPLPRLHLPPASAKLPHHRHHLRNNLSPSNSPVWKMFIQFVTEKPNVLLKKAKIFCWLFEGIIFRQGKKNKPDLDILKKGENKGKKIGSHF